MKKLSIFALSSMAVALTPTAYSADFGFGAGLDADKLKVYMPIELEKLIIEPTFIYFNREDSFYGDGITSAPLNLKVTNSFTATELGLGIFAKKTINNSFNLYAGSRVTYVSKETSIDNILVFPVDKTTTKTSLNGFSLAPTFGVKYNVTKNFTIGAEIAMKYEKLEGDSTTPVFSSSTVVGGNTSTIARTKLEESRTQTLTDIIIRYMF